LLNPKKIKMKKVFAILALTAIMTSCGGGKPEEAAPATTDTPAVAPAMTETPATTTAPTGGDSATKPKVDSTK
jgi:hypothetical protein